MLQTIGKTLALAALGCLPAACPPTLADASPPPALTAPAAATPDVPIPAAELEGIKLLSRSLQAAPTGEIFGAIIRNRSRYRLTSLTMEANLALNGEVIEAHTFTLTTDRGLPLQIFPLSTPRLESAPLPFSDKAQHGFDGYWLTLTGARGVARVPNTSLPAQDQLLDAAELGDMATLKSLLAAYPGLAKAPPPPAGAPGPASAPADRQAIRQMAPEERLKAMQAIREQHRRMNRQGATPLDLAALSDHLEAARLLIDAGADVNARDAADRTPLYEAVVSASAPIVALLLAHHADPNVRSRSGLPLDIAQRMLPQDGVGGPYQTIAQMLTKVGAQTSPPNGPPHP